MKNPNEKRYLVGCMHIRCNDQTGEIDIEPGGFSRMNVNLPTTADAIKVAAVLAAHENLVQRLQGFREDAAAMGIPIPPTTVI